MDGDELDLSKLTLTEKSDDDSLSFLEDELEAFQNTKKILLDKYNLDEKKISARELMVTVINCKLRCDESAKKYVKWLESMIPFGTTHLLNFITAHRLINYYFRY